MKAIPLIVITLLLITGCSNRLQLPTYKSGFLKDYKLFKPNPNMDDSWIRTTRHFDLDALKSYDKIALAPIELWLDKDNAYQVNNVEAQEAVTQYFEQQIKKKLSKDKSIVRQGTQGSLLIRIAITHLGEKSPDMSPLDLLPFRIVKNAGEGAYLMATEQKSVIGQASLEVELVDTDSGKGLAAVILESSTDEMYVTDAENNIDAIKTIINSWIDRLVISFGGKIKESET